MSDKDEVRLRSVHIVIATYLFSSTGASYCDKLLLRLRLSAARFCRCHLLSLASLPVLKSDSSRWTKNSPPAKGQIESEVVADVRVPNTGESRARIRGGRISGRRGVGGGSRPSVSSAIFPSNSEKVHTRLNHSLGNSPTPSPDSIACQPQPYARPVHLRRSNRSLS